MEYDPTLINRREAREPFNGGLIKERGGKAVTLAFTYGVKKREYAETVGGIPVEYAAPTADIYTSRALPFVTGDKVRMHDGTVMTVTRVSPRFNAFTGAGAGYDLGLEGGVPGG